MRAAKLFAMCLGIVLFLAGSQSYAKKQDKTPKKGAAGITETKGPRGETPAWYTEVKLTEQEKEKVRKGGYKAAFLAHTSADFMRAVRLGTLEVYKELNIKEVIYSDAEMDPTKQKTDVETALARKPDIIITLILDAVTGAEALRPAVESGVKIVLLSNLPQGYEPGRDYVGIVTDDLYGMGKAAAELLADSLNKKGNVGWIFHDADFWITNQRDNAFKSVINSTYPNIKIIAEGGIASPAEGERVASAMITQHPELNGMYVTWEEVAEGALAACRAANRPDIKIVTLDLGETTALDMAKGGNMAGVAADLPYRLGTTMATMAAYGLLGKEAPPFVIVPALKVTKGNLIEGWKESLHRDPPVEIMNIYKK
jgi:ribose transport system substrate-binding protein